MAGALPKSDAKISVFASTFFSTLAETAGGGGVVGTAGLTGAKQIEASITLEKNTVKNELEEGLDAFLPTGLAGTAFCAAGLAAVLPKIDAKMSCFFSGAFSTLGATTGFTGAVYVERKVQ